MKKKFTLFLASLTVLGLIGVAASCGETSENSTSNINSESSFNSETSSNTESNENSENSTSASTSDSMEDSGEVETYTVTFVANGSIVGVVEYEAGAESITEPDVPSKAHYTGAWETYSLSGNITVNAVYTAVEYTVTFVADGATVDTQAYTIDDQNITEPAVPSKTGYTGEWETYILTDGGNITVNAVYKEIVLQSFTVNHITRAKTETVQETATVQSADVPTVEANTYDGYAYAATVVDGTTINVYYDLVGVKYAAATTAGLISSRGETAVAEKEEGGKAMISYTRAVAGSSGNEMMVNAENFTLGNYLVLKVKVAKTHDTDTYTWVEGAERAWAAYIDFAVDMNDSSNNAKGWGYVVFSAPTSADGIWFYVNLFDWNWIEECSVESVYEMTEEGYTAFFGVDYTVNHILRDGDTTETVATSTTKSVNVPEIEPNTYDGYAYTETVADGTVVNVYYDKLVEKAYTINHITRAKTETVQATETVQSIYVPQVTAKTYDGYDYSATVVDGTTINVYYDLVGVKYIAATTEGLITARGEGAVESKEVDGKAAMVFTRTTTGASGNEMMINAAGFTAGNYLVLKVKVAKTHENPAYTWIQGEEQAWATYIDFAVGMDDSSNNEKGWGYIVFAAPTSADGAWFYVNLFDWNWVGDIAVEAVYEMTADGYNAFFAKEYTINHILRDGDTTETVETNTTVSVNAPEATPNTYEGYLYTETITEGTVINVYYDKDTAKTYTINHITRAKTETVQATTSIESKEVPTVEANSYDGYAYSGQVVDGTTINVYYDLVGVKYMAATTEGLLSVQGAGTLAATTKDGIAVINYARPTNVSQGNELLINANGYTEGNWIVIYAYVAKTQDNPAWTWIQGEDQAWAAYMDFAVGIDDASNNEKGWGYIAIQAPQVADGKFVLNLFNYNYLSVDIAAVYEMTAEGYNAFFSTEYTINHILRDGEAVETIDTSTINSMGIPEVTPNTYEGYVYTETIREGNVINVYYDKKTTKTYTVNHITRAKTETVQATTTVDSQEVPEVTANTYEGYTYSGQVVDGMTINVYYDLVGVKYHAGTESGLISARGASTITEKEVDGKLTATLNRGTNTASGNELMINASGFTAGNYLVLKVKVAKTHDNPAYTWVQGTEQAWATYIDFPVDINDSSNNDKGWGYIMFAAPTSADGTWFYVNLFDSNWLGDIAVEAVYEMTPEAYDTFFAVNA